MSAMSTIKELSVLLLWDTKEKYKPSMPTINKFQLHPSVNKWMLC